MSNSTEVVELKCNDNSLMAPALIIGLSAISAIAAFLFKMTF